MTTEEKEMILGEWKSIRDGFLNIAKIERSNTQVTDSKTEKEASNWVDHDTLVKKFEQYYSKKPPCTDKKYTHYLALALHLYQASVRNDYRTVKLYGYNPETDNYIDWDKKVFVFNDYKTAKYHGQIIIPIKDCIIQDLEDIRTYRAKQGCKYLIQIKDDKEMSSEAYSGMLLRITRKLAIHNIGSKILRE